MFCNDCIDVKICCEATCVHEEVVKRIPNVRIYRMNRIVKRKR